MVNWKANERQAVTSVWASIDAAGHGQETLERLLHVYPWSRRYFGKFGDLSTFSAIRQNPHVRTHGAKVLGAVVECLNHMDDIKGHLAQLSILHSDTLHVDPANFTLLGNCFLIVLAKSVGAGFTPDVHAACHKLMVEIADGLSRQYH
ncbi:hemoglobin cathodic subunit beta-like [Protopterus annectens]|uniref:hemoglobin cathodic subunit beta-like n=1 Tax=Protopterus annectens TaxID=7888 RepID=UPI001CFA9E6A|nr:hemoglobin cathodic subunit beta-like [Protopterus annectens]